MKMMTKFVLVCLICAAVTAATPSHAEDYEALVERAFSALDNDFSEHWSYTETSEQGEEIYVAHFDPRRPQNARWSLESVGGESPTDKEARKFLKRKNDQLEAEESTDDDSERDVGMDVVPGSIALLEETGAHWLFNFQPDGETAEDTEFMRQVDGTVKVVKDGHFVSLVHLHTDKPIKPAKGIKLSTFDTRLEFGRAAENGPIVPLSVDMKVKGRAYLVVNIDETETIRYSNFERVID